MSASPPSKYLNDLYIKQLNESVMSHSKAVTNKQFINSSFKEVY